MSVWCVVPAAGSGRRFGADIPKQYLTINQHTVMEHTLNRLSAMPFIQQVVVAISEGDERPQQLPFQNPERLQFVIGGAERADSVLAGLNALVNVAEATDWVLVHDVARPCVRAADVETLLNAAKEQGVGGILANRVRDTMKRSNAENTVTDTVDRNHLWHALTPQLFRFGLLRDALINAAEKGLAVTDEASAIEAAGFKVLLVEGARDNLKITFPEDLRLAELYLAAQASESV